MKVEPSDNTRFRRQMKEFILKHGQTRVVECGNINEDVLPDKLTCATLISSIAYKLRYLRPCRVSISSTHTSFRAVSTPPTKTISWA